MPNIINWFKQTYNNFVCKHQFVFVRQVWARAPGLKRWTLKNLMRCQLCKNEILKF